MQLEVLPQMFSVCKISDPSQADLSQALVFFAKTDEELSLVCETNNAPQNALAREDGWSGFRFQGVLDFSMVGVLAGISALLAEHQISIFAVSTYNTDYIFIKEPHFPRALSLLSQAGYSIVQSRI